MRNIKAETDYVGSADEVRLTQFSSGAGCGCKISPGVLREILSNSCDAMPNPAFDKDKLIVGNQTSDDAAVFKFTDDECVVSTTDFFMPIVDDPYQFGRIAATNAISDIYAMGATPIMAIAILGWPLKKLSTAVAGRVMQGGIQACGDAGIPLCGGHSIDSQEPIFGLAVTGRVKIQNLKRNSTAKANNVLLLSKPLGIGIITTAQKKSFVKKEDMNSAIDSMTKLNSVGMVLSEFPGVTALTDVTGFGLLGHLIEMCEGSNLSAEIIWNNIPKLPNVEEYVGHGCVPGGTDRNYISYGQKVGEMSSLQKAILCDPQTSGGLLMAVDKAEEDKVKKEVLEKCGIVLHHVGRLCQQSEITGKAIVKIM